VSPVILGSKCPFKVLTFTDAATVHYNAIKGEGIAGQISTGSAAWNQRLDEVSSFMRNTKPEHVSRCDLIKAASHMIIVEGFDANGNINPLPPKQLKSYCDSTATTF
jgi:hypothetical protein